MKLGAVVLFGFLGLLAFSCSTGSTDPIVDGGTSSIAEGLSSGELLSSGVASSVAASSIAASSVAASSIAASSSAAITVPAAMTFDFTMVDPTPDCAYGAGTCYEPKSVVAVWVETEAGAFVRTLYLTGQTSGKRWRWLLTWQLAAGGTPGSSTTEGNIVDAVTGATTNAFTAISTSWNVHDVSGAVVANGNYVVKAEFTSDHVQGPIASVPFTVGASNQTVTPTNTTYITNMTLNFTAAH